jgi:hypothetical protein
MDMQGNQMEKQNQNEAEDSIKRDEHTERKGFSGSSET